MTIRLLTQADHAEFDRFLSGHAETSMFLRSNARKAGLDYAGEFYQALYYGAFDGDRLVGVIALNWNGNVMVQAPQPAALDALLGAACAAQPDYMAKGVVAGGEQAACLLERLKPAPADIQLSEVEPLFRLNLDRLRTPDALVSGQLTWRGMTPGDLDPVGFWRIHYDIETIGGLRPEMQADPRGALLRWLSEGRGFVVEADDEPVAMASWNAELPDIVQIGGVYTPPELRSRGYGRAAVAAALIAAREKGAASAILFTHTPAAERAYRALGFEQVGTYHLAIFREGVRLGDIQRGP